MGFPGTARLLIWTGGMFGFVAAKIHNGKGTVELSREIIGFDRSTSQFITVLQLIWKFYRSPVPKDSL